MILKDRVAIVTGAGSGIGLASARIMAREGAIVVVTDRSEEAANTAVEKILAEGGRAQAIVTDVSDDASIEHMIQATLKQHQRIDILHNHAGIQVEGTLEQVSVEGFDKSFLVNVHAHFVASRLVVPGMKERGGGVILNTSSGSGIFYDREMIAYTTSKHAAVAMTRQMAVDYAQFNIRVNALCPGWVDTPFNDAFVRQRGSKAAIDSYVSERVPMGRWGTTQEMAEAVLFLVSDRSSYMTGQALVIDGGEAIA